MVDSPKKGDIITLTDDSKVEVTEVTREGNKLVINITPYDEKPNMGDYGFGTIISDAGGTYRGFVRVAYDYGGAAWVQIGSGTGLTAAEVLRIISDANSDAGKRKYDIVVKHEDHL